MANSQLLDILLIATVAGIVLFRLYTVLGRRTGNERPPQENYRFSGNAPDDAAITHEEGRAAVHAAAVERPSDPVYGFGALASKTPPADRPIYNN